MTQLLDCVLAVIAIAHSAEDLRAWRDDHTHLVPLLTPAERGTAASALDARLAVLEIEALPTSARLAAWWTANQARLRNLPPPERASVTAAKDARKAALTPMIGPPPIVRPWSGPEATCQAGRLL
jgi:hypothetical protein